MGTLKDITERKRSFLVRVQVHGERHARAFRFTWQNRNRVLKQALAYRDRMLCQRNGTTPFPKGRNKNK